MQNNSMVTISIRPSFLWTCNTIRQYRKDGTPQRTDRVRESRDLVDLAVNISDIYTTKNTSAHPGFRCISWQQ